METKENKGREKEGEGKPPSIHIFSCATGRSTMAIACCDFAWR